MEMGETDHLCKAELPQRSGLGLYAREQAAVNTVEEWHCWVEASAKTKQRQACPPWGAPDECMLIVMRPVASVGQRHKSANQCGQEAEHKVVVGLRQLVEEYRGRQISSQGGGGGWTGRPERNWC